MSKKLPILLSFYALSNGSATLLFGQLTYTRLNDLSFKDYSRRRTFRTLLSLYRTKPYANQDITLIFGKEKVEARTNASGAFYGRAELDLKNELLQKVMLSTGEEVTLVDGLYRKNVHYIDCDHIVVSDIDDTLLHSFISKKFLKFRTLMFTTVEKRKAVVNMQHLMKEFIDSGASPFYLSNSEQNLYPLIYRFLLHNKFPQGPLFLKQLRRLRDVLFNTKFPPRNIHKVSTLNELICFFSNKKFVLMGDNTQQDLSIYLEVAEKFPSNIRCIIIRKVVEKPSDQPLIDKANEKFRNSDIKLYYGEEFPASFLSDLAYPVKSN